MGQCVCAAIFPRDTAEAKAASTRPWPRLFALALSVVSCLYLTPLAEAIDQSSSALPSSLAAGPLSENPSADLDSDSVPVKASNSPSSNSSNVSLGELRAKSQGSAKVIQASKAFSLGSGTILTVVSGPEWSPLGAKLAALLKQSHSRFESLFGDIPSFAVTLRLMDEEAFFLSTGAPRWTNALFYRGQIIIPLSPSEPIDFENISRSVKHEYTHAVIHALTAGKTPGWIDEGLAQLAEGTENSALRPALYEYLKENPPVPFELMQGGFTRLETHMVAAAYAQSLIAAQALVETFGYDRLGLYFSTLRSGEDHESAFRSVFGIREANFEDRFARKLSRWANTYEVLNRAPGIKAVSNPTWAETEEDLGSVKARGF